MSEPRRPVPGDEHRARPLRPHPDARSWRHRLLPGATAGRAAWLATAVLLGCSLAITVGLQLDAAGLRRSYGAGQTVWVLRRDVPAGSALRAGDLEARPVPAAFLAAGPADAGTDQTGRITTVALTAGEVLLERRLADAAERGPTALLAPGSVGLTVPTPVPAGVTVGDAVVLVLTGDGSSATASRGTGRAAGPIPATVIGIGAGHDGDGQVVVAVAAGVAVEVAAAAQADRVAIGLVSSADR